jgi:hypothetical protein
LQKLTQKKNASKDLIHIKVAQIATFGLENMDVFFMFKINLQKSLKERAFSLDPTPGPPSPGWSVGT